MYKDRILKLLRASGTGFLSGEDLASKMGISRTMVWKHIKALEREGFTIEAVPSQGYRIIASPDILRRDEIKAGLKTKVIGKELHLFPEVISTNTVAMEMASKDAPEGTVVLAEVQTGGKGRLGRKWISPSGNLFLSVVLRPRIATHKAPLITLLGAVAAAAAIRQFCGVPAGIKWPNDILINGKKAGGLLTEMSAEPDRIKHIVLGIGLDVNMEMSRLPPDLRAAATTLSAEAHRTVDRTALLRQLLQELDQRYAVFIRNPEDVLKEWESLNVTIGNRVVVGGAGETFEGIAEGTDSEGRLIVRIDEGTTRTVAAGDVTILKKT